MTFQLKVAGKVIKPSKPKPESKRGELWGTGFTKKQMATAEKVKTVEPKTPQDLSKIRTIKLLGTETSRIYGTGKPPGEEIAKPLKTVSIPHGNHKTLHADVKTPLQTNETKLASMDDSIVYDESQLAAIKGVLSNRVSCIIGSAGTGKTTISNNVISAIEKYLPIIDITENWPDKRRENSGEIQQAAMCVCSFTGKATEQIKRALPPELHNVCKTIHATLAYAPVFEDRIDEDTQEMKTIKIFRPTFTSEQKLSWKFVVIDEGGTVPIPLFNELIAALPKDVRIIILGDINQLPPVQGRSVLGFAMLKWPTFELTTIHRTALDNPIISNAHRILNGMCPVQSDCKKVIVKYINDYPTKAYVETMKIIRYLNQHDQFNPLTDAFITPMNKNTLGQIHFNEKLVDYFNPIVFDAQGVAINPRNTITAGRTHFFYAIGDKIMLLQNDTELGLTNGMTGVITNISRNAAYHGPTIQDAASADKASMVMDTEIDLAAMFDDVDKQTAASEYDTSADDDPKKRQASHIVTCQFNEKEITFSTSGAFSKISHAYAFTCHKAQGSEFNTVIVMCHSSDSVMLCREWLYTAITRAKEKVIILCNSRGLQQAVKRQTIKGNTLEQKAKAFLAVQNDPKSTENQIPNLINPVTVDIKGNAI